MKVLDLFCGLGGFSAAFRDRGHFVVGIDNDPRLEADMLGDVTKLPIKASAQFDVILASPPCTQFAPWAFPESWRRGKPRIVPAEGLQLVKAAVSAIEMLRPRFWVVENVRGAVQWLQPILGPPAKIVGPYKFWGKFPELPYLSRNAYTKGYGKWKLPPSSMRPALRSKIPYSISEAFCRAIENA